METMESTMTTSTVDCPVSMIRYSDKALPELLAELVTSDIVEKKGKGNKKEKIYNIAASFDTEASSFMDYDAKPVGLCYVWMFGIGKTVVYGRELWEFVAMLSRINGFCVLNKTRLIVYVHFLKYDFSFIKHLFKWDDVFIRGSREPLYARWLNIEFRDSLALAGGAGLATIGKKLRTPVKKAVGDLDYELIRTPKTPLTQRELHYCEMDIRVLNQYITEKIEDDGDITKIPLTNTGYVRRYVREECFRNRGAYMDLIDGLTLTSDGYLQCEKAFAGGAVGPNIKYAGEICYDVHSRDVKSDYPKQMVTKYFPMTFFTPVPNSEANARLEELVTSKCCLFRLEIFNLVPKTDWCFPISYSKCNECVGYREASGRVMYASYVSINVTEIDYQIFKRFYNFDEAEKIRVSRMRVAERGYLPKPIVKSVLKFFHDKTTLDGVEGREKDYMLAKNMLNACYGMMVQKPVRDEFIFSDDFDKMEKDYIRQVDEYNENRNRFLYYPWGVWVTAHARAYLYDAIWNIGDDWRYCDTDSVKYVGDHDDYFNRVNDEAIESLKECAKRYNFSMDFVVPKAPDGSPKYLGIWEHEYDAHRFKTIGAKRYLVHYATGKHAGEIELTVAGTNKKSTLEYMKEQASLTSTDIFDLFSPDLVIPAEYAKRTVSKFVDAERCGRIVDYLGQESWYSSKSGVYVEPASYSFSMTQEMMDAINWLRYNQTYDGGEW